MPMNPAIFTSPMPIPRGLIKAMTSSTAKAANPPSSDRSAAGGDR